MKIKCVNYVGVCFTIKGFLQKLMITWQKIELTLGQRCFYSRTGTSKRNQDGAAGHVTLFVILSCILLAIQFPWQTCTMWLFVANGPLKSPTNESTAGLIIFTPTVYRLDNNISIGIFCVCRAFLQMQVSTAKAMWHRREESSINYHRISD